MRLFFPMCLLAMCLMATIAAAGPIDLAGRDVLLDTEPQERHSPIQLALSPESTSFLFGSPRGKNAADTQYAAFIGGLAAGAPPPEIRLNEKLVELDPVVRDDGFVYLLPGGYFLEEVNSLNVRGAGVQADNVTVQVFSLLDTFEEVHFGRAFSKSVTKVSPAKHASQDNFDVQHYDLAITINMANTNVSGVLRAECKVTAASLSVAALDFDDNGGAMGVSLVETSVNGGAYATTATYTWNTASNWLIVTLPSTLATNDTFGIRVTYSGTPATDGAFGPGYNRGVHNSTIPYIYTFSEPYKARKWWPCKDLPDDKATMDMHVTAPKTVSSQALTVVSNGKLISTDDLGANNRWNYSESYPIATYQASLCATNYAFSSGTYTSQDATKTMPVGHYYYPENNETGRVPGTLAAMNFFAQTFGEYPYIDEKYVTVTHSNNSGMEHTTCTSMPPGTGSEGTRENAGEGRRNIHELSHHWFGDSVTCDTFNHLWLNEGFATYCEALYYEQRDGKAAYDSYVAAWDAGSNTIPGTRPMVDPNADDFSGALVYRKGGWVLHMLRHVVGDTVFFDGLRDHLVANHMGTAVTEDFQAAMEGRYGESLSYFFQQWAYRAGRPAYAWDWSRGGGGSANTVELSITQSQAGGAFTMPIDIRVTYSDGTSETFVVFNDQTPQNFALSTGSKLATGVEFDPGNYILKTVTGPPTTPAPTLLRVLGGTSASPTATIQWASGGGTTSGFQLYESTDLASWTRVADENVLGSLAVSYTRTGLNPSQPYYYRLSAVSATDAPSPFTDTYGVRIAADPAMKVLVVDGYDRLATGHAYAAWHGAAVAAYPAGFDTTANESVTGGQVLLGGYKAVLWGVGEESTTDETFSTAEQTLVQTYLNAGGRLLATGAEIGWDIDQQGSTADKAFYNNYLKTDYVTDDSNDYTVTGTVGGIFDGLAFSFDDGTHGSYRSEFPDVLAAFGGSTDSLEYSAGVIAATQYSGNFPSGVTPGRGVTFGFAFETIYPEATRNDVMERILNFFEVTPEAAPTPTPSPTESPTPTETPASPTPTESPSPTPSPTASPIPTDTPTLTESPSPTPSLTPVTPSPTESPTPTETPITPTASASPSPTPSATAAPSPTGSLTPTPSPTAATLTPTASPSPSPTASPTAAPTASPTPTASPAGEDAWIAY